MNDDRHKLKVELADWTEKSNAFESMKDVAQQKVVRLYEDIEELNKKMTAYKTEQNKKEQEQLTVRTNLKNKLAELN